MRRTHGDDGTERDLATITAVCLRGMHTHDNGARNPCLRRKGSAAGVGVP
jgi:hypothetical protein